MLSAVAARKAALAAHQGLTTPPVGPEILSSSATPSRLSTTPPQHASKRKPSTQGPNQPGKAKKKKTKHKEARYFAVEDSFVQQDDVIVINNDDSEESVPEIDSDDPLLPPSKAIMVERSARSKTKPPWSPVLPLQDSSDEEVGDSEDEPYTPKINSPPRATIEEERGLLSTFEPRWNSNVFSFSSAEIRFLESSSLFGDSTSVIVMTPGDSLSLLGTYALTVIHGSIYLAGVTLTPSETTHHVFSPRCSPVPALHCLQCNKKPRDPTLLPDRLHPFLKADCAILAFRDLRTGVDGLGRVCRTFEDVFEPSRWHRNEVVPDLGLTGVRMVHFSVVSLRAGYSHCYDSSYMNIETSSRLSFHRHGKRRCPPSALQYRQIRKGTIMSKLPYVW
jgi:polynucleotide 5'-hydroxyl-kinase GRC3/NOL9